MRPSLLLPLSLLLIIGCAHSPSSSTADSHPSSLSPTNAFESSQDPPLTVQTRFAAAQFAESQGNTPNAIAQYRAALKLNPKHLPSLYRLGILYTQSKQFPQAIEIWERYVAATSGSADAYSNLAFCQELAGHPHDAEAAYLKGLAADQHNAPCQINYGLLLARLGRDAEALYHMQQVLSPPEAHYNLASVYESLGQKEQAKLEYRKALDLNPHFADAESRLTDLP